MLAGRFSLDAPTTRRPADLALTLALSDGRELRYRDDVQMGKAYVIEAGGRRNVPGLSAIGVDVLDAKAFSRAAFRALAKTRRDQVKVFLMDKSALDALGNAYADEALFEAQIHPKTFVRSLSPQEIDRLHDAVTAVIAKASAEVARRAPPLDEKVRDFLKVRNRHGQPCPRCGSTIRKAGVHGHDAFFCPTCQPDERGSSIVDFRAPSPPAPRPSRLPPRLPRSREAAAGPEQQQASTLQHGYPQHRYPRRQRGSPPQRGYRQQQRYPRQPPSQPGRCVGVARPGRSKDVAGRTRIGYVATTPVGWLDMLALVRDGGRGHLLAPFSAPRSRRAPATRCDPSNQPRRPGDHRGATASCFHRDGR